MPRLMLHRIDHLCSEYKDEFSFTTYRSQAFVNFPTVRNYVSNRVRRVLHLRLGRHHNECSGVFLQGCSPWNIHIRVPGMPVRILIADDDAAIRRLLRRLIETHGGWTVCADARDGHEAVDKTEDLNPDVVVLDLAMPDMNGLQAAREISRKHPGLPMLLFTVQQVSKELRHQALNAGCRGALSKNTGSEIVHAIEVLLNHQNFFQPIRSDAPVW